MFDEAKTLEILNHENLIAIESVYKDRFGKLNMVMEYAEGGSLQDRINQ